VSADLDPFSEEFALNTFARIDTTRTDHVPGSIAYEWTRLVNEIKQAGQALLAALEAEPGREVEAAEFRQLLGEATA
jgi:hypothetical protein